MPQANDELRAQMKEYFGDPIDDSGPRKFLETHGFSLTKDWCWKSKKTYDTMTRKEFECIMFLAHEWDFGGLAK